MDEIIKKEFLSITGLPLKDRETNNINERTVRKDILFSQLTKLYFYDKPIFNKLSPKILVWGKKDKSETMLALAGYTYYLKEDFNKAAYFFYKATSLKPLNLDNWVDLAFCLRHLGKNNISQTILFQLDYCIYYYMFLKINLCNYRNIHKLTQIIKQYAD